MSKLKFILLFFILISIISVALAETDQSTTAEKGVKEDDILLRVTILSLMLVAISLLLSHHMGDHDEYAKRLRKLQYYCMYCKTRDEPSIEIAGNKTDKEILEDCIRFSITLNHFGHICFTLISCLFVATFIATALIIEIMPSCEPSLTNPNLLVFLIIFAVNIILLTQLWFYLRQGNRIACWIKELQKNNFEGFCKKYLKKRSVIVPVHGLGKALTKMRLGLARNLFDDCIQLTDILFIIWFIILVIIIILFCG